MSESEFVKHSKKIIAVSTDRSRRFKSRVVDIIGEIFIIVIAITISFLFEKWREKQMDQKLEKEFFQGLNTDLNDDLKELKSDSATYMLVAHSLKYLRDYDVTANPHPDSLAKYGHWLFNTTGLIPNTSRIDALKFSGKIGVIENKDLLDKILNLYQEEIPSLIIETSSFTDYKTKLLLPYYYQNIAYSGGNLVEQLRSILPKDQFKVYLDYDGIATHIAQHYHSIINSFEEVQRMVTKELEEL